MQSDREIPSFDDYLPRLDQFIHELAGLYKAGHIQSWNGLEKRVKAYFTPTVMDQTETLVPHWRKMASYAEGITLVHVMCVFMGLYIMPEFLSMTRKQQQLMKWVILFHDIEKELLPGIRDHSHAFRSTAGAARTLPKLGFPVTLEYDSLIDEWDVYTRSASTKIDSLPDPVQDNRKLPKIIEGIERMFGHNTSTALVLKTILFHMSVNMGDWPPPNPITDEEVILYFDLELTPLLMTMNLGDADGWMIFDPPNWEHGRLEVIEIFGKVEKMISNKSRL